MIGYSRYSSACLCLCLQLGPLLLGSLNNLVLVVDLQDAGVLANGLRPPVEVRALMLEPRDEIGRQGAVLGQGKQSNDEWGCEDLVLVSSRLSAIDVLSCLCKGELIAAAEEGSCVLEKRLDLLDDTSKSIVSSLVDLVICLRSVDSRGDMRLDLARVGISKEANPGSDQSPIAVRGRGQKSVVGIGVYEELGDDGGLGDGLAIVDNGGNEASRVDLQILWGARSVQVNDLLLERKAEFL